MMHRVFLIFWIVCCFGNVQKGAAQKKTLLKKLWETPKVFEIPESIVFDKNSRTLFVSLINGATNEKDGVGGIAKLDTNGKLIAMDWVTGLNAPKGLAIYNDMLFVADIDEVVAIDMKTSGIVLRIPVANAKFLNDVTVDGSGIVYVSDMEKGTVHRIENGKAALWLENISGINGLNCNGSELYLLAKGVLWKAESNSQLLMIAEGMDESTDGLELTPEKDFIVSAWSGILYYVSAKGKVVTLSDTRSQKLNTGDICYDPSKKIIYVPTFFDKRVIAYQLKLDAK